MADATPNPPSSASPNEAAARTLDYRGRGNRGNDGNAHPGVRFRDKLRRAFSRDSLLSVFKTLLWAVPLTILIWIYAERDGELTVNGYSLAVALQQDDPHDIHRRLHLESPKDGQIRVDLKGPRAKLEALEKDLSEEAEPPLINVDRNLPAGDHNIPIDAQVSNYQKFVDAGVTVSNFEPAEIAVDVDPLKWIDLEVQAPPSVSLASPAAFEPRNVHVHIPQSLLDNDAKYGAFVQLDAFDTKTPGKRELNDVPVAIYRLTATGRESTPLNDRTVTINPAFVSATIDVKNSDESYSIGVLPVWPTMEIDMQDKFRVTLGVPVQNGVLHNVTVVGPPEAIAELKKPGTYRPIASFEVDSSKQEPNTSYTATIHIEGLPHGVSPSDPNLTVTYLLVDRASGG